MDDNGVEDLKLKEEIRREIKRAKGFGWKLVTIILSILLIFTIILSVLFATGMLSVKESSDGSLRLEYTSPFKEAKEDEDKKANQGNSNNQNKSNESESPKLAGFDFKLDDLKETAEKEFEGYNIYISDFKVSSNGKYIIAVVSPRSKEDNRGSELRYYIRTTESDASWKIINKATVCIEVNDDEYDAVAETYPDLQFSRCINTETNK
ncbi:hypothetical protein IKM56_03035 [Candidatus Saccharibacteria bacterium]|nr:hypothetical protein [Candidatus Saccharibacteria bacterium]